MGVFSHVLFVFTRDLRTLITIFISEFFTQLFNSVL